MINSAAKAPQEPPNPGQIRQECSAFPAPSWGLMKECDPTGFIRELSGFLWEWGHGGSGQGEEIGEEGLEKIPGLIQGWEGEEQLLGGGEGKGAPDPKVFPTWIPTPILFPGGFFILIPNPIPSPGVPDPEPDPISKDFHTPIPTQSNLQGFPHPNPGPDPILGCSSSQSQPRSHFLGFLTLILTLIPSAGASQSHPQRFPNPEPKSDPISRRVFFPL